MITRIKGKNFYGSLTKKELLDLNNHSLETRLLIGYDDIEREIPFKLSLSYKDSYKLSLGTIPENAYIGDAEKAELTISLRQYKKLLAEGYLRIKSHDYIYNILVENKLKK